MTVPINGPWEDQQLTEFLQTQLFPIRLASVGKDGFPRVLSLWYFYADGKLHCVSHRASVLIKILKNNNSVGFEVSPNDPPYFGARGQGVATLSSEGAGYSLEHLIQRYLGDGRSSLADWLLSRKAEELLITITPTRFHSWDYRERMTGLRAVK